MAAFGLVGFVLFLLQSLFYKPASAAPPSPPGARVAAKLTCCVIAAMFPEGTLT